MSDNDRTALVGKTWVCFDCSMTWTQMEPDPVLCRYCLQPHIALMGYTAILTTRDDTIDAHGDLFLRLRKNIGEIDGGEAG